MHKQYGMILTMDLHKISHESTISGPKEVGNTMSPYIFYSEEKRKSTHVRYR
jgi:hypothetical protein